MYMYFSDTEKQIMGNLFKSINENESELYTLSFSNGDIFAAKADTCYETDNGLDENEKGVEEFHACAFRIVEIFVNKSGSLEKGKLIEISYHNYPQEIKNSQGCII